jgi:uncharacterized protein (DUF427 family)
MPMSDLVIVAADGTWVVRAGGAVIGESSRAMELTEADGPGVIYFPREDLGMAFLEPSAATAASATLGTARYFGIVTKSGLIPDVAWSYETPAEGAERIAGHIAFDARRVAVEEV